MAVPIILKHIDDARKLPCTSLRQWLADYGYPPKEAEDISEAYVKDGVIAAVEVFKWADDEEHDYTGELNDVICGWVWGTLLGGTDGAIVYDDSWTNRYE